MIEYLTGKFLFHKLLCLQLKHKVPYIENHQGQDPLNDYKQQTAHTFRK